MEKREPVSAGFSLLLPLSSLASVVEGVSLFILVQGVRLCFDRQWGVSHCILEPGGPPRRVGQDWYRQGKSRVGIEDQGGGWGRCELPGIWSELVDTLNLLRASVQGLLGIGAWLFF